MRLPRWTARPEAHAAGCLLALLAALAVVAFAIGTLEYTKTRGKLLLTALLVAGYFLTMVGATAMPRAGPGPWFRPLAFSAATMALALMVLGLWGTADSNAFWKATAATTVLAMGLVAAGQALSRAEGGTAVRVAAICSAALAAALVAMGVLAIALEIGAAPFWWAFGLVAVGWVLFGLVLAGMRLLLAGPGR